MIVFSRILFWGVLFSGMIFPIFTFADDVTCANVAQFDFKNAVLSVKDDVALSSGTTDPDALPFKDGKCEIKDEQAPKADGDATSNQPDWRYEMVGDFMMHPVRGADVRVIRIFENHLSGSGSWDRLLAFRCKGGQLQKIWQKRFSEGIKVTRVNEIQFKVQPLVKPTTKAKPKNSELGLYQWDNTHGTFKRR